jgi:hypothetical protein
VAAVRPAIDKKAAGSADPLTTVMFERDGEDPDPEIRNPEIDLSFCVEMQTLEQRDIRRDATVNAGKRICPMTQANWRREKKTASNVIATSHDASVFRQPEMLREFRNRSP